MAVTRALVAACTHLDADTARRVLTVASELVSLYGSSAPPPVVDEAVIRVCVYLGTHSATGARSEAVEDLRTVWVTSSRSPLRASGAEGILSPYKRRRCSKVPLEATE